MINLYLYNVMVPLYKLQEEFNGGYSGFQQQVKEFKIQEDEYLLCVKVKNATEVSRVIDALIDGGLHFDHKSETSTDFCVLAKEGMWWECPWLVYNLENAWFIADVEAPA